MTRSVLEASLARAGAKPRARLATTTGALPGCSTVRRRRPLPAPRPVHPPPRGVPPAADKNALRTQLKVNMLRIRERELLFFTNNCLSISTSAVSHRPHAGRLSCATCLPCSSLTCPPARPPTQALLAGFAWYGLTEVPFDLEANVVRASSFPQRWRGRPPHPLRTASPAAHRCAPLHTAAHRCAVPPPRRSYRRSTSW